jgi:transcriptional regulator with XRE-family HTH domain
MTLPKNKVSPSETEELRMAAGAWLQEIRKAAGLKQRDLAIALDFDYYTFVSQLENGRGRVPAHKYRDWARMVGVDEKVFAKKMLGFYDPVSYDILFGDEDSVASS